MKNRALLLFCGMLMLGGCASQQQASSSVPATPPPSPTYVPGELNQESVYELLAAEIAGQKHQFGTALKYYLDQAEKTRDAGVAERATRIAQFMRDSKAVLKAAGIWAKADPTNPEPLHISANILLQEHRFDEALPILRKVLRDDSADAILLIGSISQNLPPESAKVYDKLLAEVATKQPKRVDLILTRALIKRRLGDTDAALKLLDRGLKLKPHQADLVLQKAEILRTQGDEKAALALVNAALKAHPDSTPLNVQRVQLLVGSQPKTAIRLMHRLIKKTPDDQQLHYYFALLLLDNKQLAASRDILESMLQRNPRSGTLHFYLGVIAEEQGHTEQALTHYRAVDSGPNLEQAYARSLNLMPDASSRGDVEALIDSGIKDHPELNAALTLMLADWLHQHGDDRDALQRLDTALKSHPDDVNLLYTRALVIESSDSTEMLKDLEHAYTLQPDNPMLQNALGYSLAVHTQQYQRAHFLISQALQQKPDDPAVLDSMGWVLHKLGRNQEALTFLQRAYDQFSDPEVASHLIQVLWHLDRKAEARALLQKSLAQDPDNADLKAAAQRMNAQ